MTKMALSDFLQSINDAKRCNLRAGNIISMEHTVFMQEIAGFDFGGKVWTMEEK
jgi:hypothetical protein